VQRHDGHGCVGEILYGGPEALANQWHRWKGNQTIVVVIWPTEDRRVIDLSVSMAFCPGSQQNRVFFPKGQLRWTATLLDHVLEKR
jgi:hypothetical protein